MESIEKGIHAYVTEERLVHSKGVRDTAVALAVRYHCDKEKASAASIFMYSQ